MINGLGVLGWGVGGIEAEAAMLGQPMFLQKPTVVGVRTRGTLPPGTTATDLVLTLTQMLRAHRVVGKFVEFFGAGLSALSVESIRRRIRAHLRRQRAMAEHARAQDEGTPLIVIAGKEYGSGSSRDWAAKGSALLGIKAVIAQSYERIHRSNLVCMGILPLQFEPEVSAQSLGLTGFETFSIAGIGADITPRQTAKVTAQRQDGSQVEFATLVRIDAPAEVEYFLHGGILQMVLRELPAA